MFIIGGASPPTSITLPAGFTLLQGPSTQTNSGFSVDRRLAYKVASGESGNYTITHATANTDAIMVAISGASATAPVSSNNGGGGTTTTAFGVVTPSNNSAVLFLATTGCSWHRLTALRVHPNLH